MSFLSRIDFYRGFDVPCMTVGSVMAREVFAAYRRHGSVYGIIERNPPTYICLFAALARRIKNEGISLPIKTEDAILRYMISEWTVESLYETSEGFVKARYEPRWPAYVPDFDTVKTVLVAVAETFNKVFERRLQRAISSYRTCP